jgi:hypothetical protein
MSWASRSCATWATTSPGGPARPTSSAAMPRAQPIEPLAELARLLDPHRLGDPAELLEHLVRDVLERRVVGLRVDDHERRAVQRGQPGGALERLLARGREVEAGDDRRERHASTLARGPGAGAGDAYSRISYESQSVSSGFGTRSIVLAR